VVKARDIFTRPIVIIGRELRVLAEVIYYHGRDERVEACRAYDSLGKYLVYPGEGLARQSDRARLRAYKGFVPSIMEPSEGEDADKSAVDLIVLSPVENLGRRRY
jgi:hypothetical protein